MAIPAREIKHMSIVPEIFLLKLCEISDNILL